jgi:serine/threonine protein phosphatase PrpC
VFAVADGASHPGHGGVAATLAIAEFALAVAAAPPSHDSRYRVQAAVACANACVRYYGDHQPYTGMQTTLCAAVVWDGVVVMVSVGDSRIVLIRDGSVLPPLQSQAYGLPKSFVGASTEVPTMAMEWFFARDLDRLIAMTDGLNCLSLEEIGDIASSEQPLTVAETMLRESHSRSDDDVACVVADLGYFPVVSAGTGAAAGRQPFQRPADRIQQRQEDRPIEDPLDG